VYVCVWVYEYVCVCVDVFLDFQLKMAPADDNKTLNWSRRWNPPTRLQLQLH